VNLNLIDRDSELLIIAMGGICTSPQDEKSTPKPLVSPQEAKRERDINAEIEALMHQGKLAEGKVKRLLLLGAGDSGKSTLFKQARKIYGNQFTEEELLDYLPKIVDNVVTNMRILIEHADAAELENISDRDKSAIKVIQETDTHAIFGFTPHLGKAITAIWALPCIQSTFDRRSEFQLQDSIRYYCERIMDMCKENFIPSFEDVLQCRQMTIGVTEMAVEMKNSYVKFVDVGGQKTQRMKWLSQFSRCQAIIFVAAINEYDQTLFEDEATNRLMESLFLFDFVCNRSELMNLNLILFLNKRDLFEEKLVKRKIPLSTLFPDYTGGSDFRAGCTYLAQKFQERNSNHHRDMYIHVTCATDTNNIKSVLNDLTDMVLVNSMQDLGVV
jgi:GTPase SAR1 family protein